jgi:hypothetical protein
MPVGFKQGVAEGDQAMRAIYWCAASCALSALLLLSCSSPKPDSSPGGEEPVALGEITVDRCLLYMEGEDFKEKAGGDLDLKEAASGKRCLGMRWGEKLTDFVTYRFVFENPSESTVLVIRAAFDNPFPQSYKILVDGQMVQTAILEPTGGYGYTEKEWKCFSISLGRIAKGPHTLTIRPSKVGQILNIDCLALGKAG